MFPRMTAARRPARRILLILAAVGAAVLLPVGAAWADVTATVHTATGDTLNVRTGPSVAESVVGTVADGQSITIDCQTYGDTISGVYGTTAIWDHIPASAGYVSDAYVDTGSTGMVAPACDDGTDPPSDLDAAIVQLAQQQMADDSRNHEIGGYNCNYYTTSLGEPGTGAHCSNGWHTEEWCADFAKWVWLHAGADVSDANPLAISFRTYGKNHGTWHAGNPQKADAIVFQNHVGIVVSATASTVTYISGNTSNPNGSGTNAVNIRTMSRSNSSILGYSDPVA